MPELELPQRFTRPLTKNRAYAKDKAKRDISSSNRACER